MGTQDAPGIVLRPATLDDVSAIRAILAAHGNDGPVDAVDIVGPYVRHLVLHARTLVAVEAEAVVAFGSLVDAGVAHHLGDLFVRPDRLGRGLGGRLLQALFGDTSPRTTFASDDPRAFALYVRSGMLPYWPYLTLRGVTDRLPGAPATLSIEPADAARLAALEQAWTGANRAIDHAFWASLPEADSFVVLEADEPVALAHARARQIGPVRAIDRMLVRPGSEPVRPTLAAIRRAARSGPLDATILGPSPVLPILLAAGFQLTERDMYMASEPGLVDPARIIPDGGML